MKKRKLILLPSQEMDRNKKADRNENGLVRMSAKAREFLGFRDDQVEVWTAAGGTEERKNSAVLLDIFQAYASDITKIRRMVRSGQLKADNLNRIGFVTTKMYNRITGGNDEKNIWISSGVHDLVTGADPEFLLFNSHGRVVNAQGLMGKKGIIGGDGAMAEVRPKPSISPDGLVNNIFSAFADEALTSKIKDFDWICGCYHRDSSRDYPIGGHLHIGNPARVAHMSMPRRELFYNVLNKIMDEFVSIPCIRLDGEMGSKRRAHCQMSLGQGGWGFFGEWRTCSGRLEHRTLSGMWLMHPSVAKCVIGTAKAITDEAFKLWAHNNFDHSYVVPDKYSDLGRDMNKDGFRDWNKFPICKDFQAEMTSAELRRILNESKGGDITKSWLDNWLRKMKNLSTYSKYGLYIRGLKEILSVPMSDLSKWDRKIQSNWLKSKKFIVDIG